MGRLHCAARAMARLMGLEGERHRRRRIPEERLDEMMRQIRTLADDPQ